ncbi:MAG: KilA-N domain-containing protein, partial [Sporomusaceae bacterium]|nr:KilA-N domain-containing protein [Sporomusaceae bacterium]
MPKKETVNVQGTEIAVLTHRQDDYISLTDIAKYKDEQNPRFIIQNWLRNRNTVEFLGIWEILYNQNFNRVEFEAVKIQTGLNSFVMTPQKWIETTGAIGITSKAGRYGGTYAHREIAYEFAAWVSVEFKLYLVKEFDRLKNDEVQRQSLEWNLQRTLSKINYRIHTDAIKEQIIPKKVTRAQAAAVYASEADLLNVALFGMTAAEWRVSNPDKDGNMRDHATLEQLVVLSNLESINALLIRQDLPQNERLPQLN